MCVCLYVCVHVRTCGGSRDAATRRRRRAASRLAKRPLLHGRYFPLSLLGKGGFSEVWHAMDLVTSKEVAIKIHQVSASMSDTQKGFYVKRAAREYNIHEVWSARAGVRRLCELRAQSLKHENVVGFYGAFEIDLTSFATVLEYCRGPDLDARLRQAGTLTEREARLIVQYILRALYYLNNVRVGALSLPQHSRVHVLVCCAHRTS